MTRAARSSPSSRWVVPWRRHPSYLVGWWSAAGGGGELVEPVGADVLTASRSFATQIAQGASTDATTSTIGQLIPAGRRD